MPLVFDPSSRGKKVLYCDGFYYHRLRTGYWRCADSRCQIIFRTTGDETTDEVKITKKFRDENPEICKHGSEASVLNAYLLWVRDLHDDEYVENIQTISKC